MKIAYLAASNSIHTCRWVNALAKRDYRVILLTMQAGREPLDDRIQVIKLPIPAPCGYFLNAPYVKKILAHLQPDLLHVHYASGYGTLGRLTGFQPQMLSVWGSDVFDFPEQSWLHRRLLVKNLQTATQICSTSHFMAQKTSALCHSKAITVIPFGIDTSLFYPYPHQRDNRVLKIGTVKTLAPKYGIDTLIYAFYNLRKLLTESSPALAKQLRLQIAGEGPQRIKLQSLINQLKLATVTELTGHLPHAKVPDYLNQLHIYVAASRLESESFGVAVLEASACGLPVVVSKVGGLPEVVQEGVSGLLVAKDNVNQFTEALLKLVHQPTWRDQLGQGGRALVVTKYRWDEQVEKLVQLYQNFCH